MVMSISTTAMTTTRSTRPPLSKKQASRAILLIGEMDTEYLIGPITPEVEAAVPKYDAAVQQYSDGGIEVGEVPDDLVTQLDAEHELVHRYETPEELIEAMRNWAEEGNTQDSDPWSDGWDDA